MYTTNPIVTGHPMTTRSRSYQEAPNTKTVHLPPTARMMTRSQYKIRDELEVEIDFDGASRAWVANKVSIGNGCYRYKKNVPLL